MPEPRRVTICKTSLRRQIQDERVHAPSNKACDPCCDWASINRTEDQHVDIWKCLQARIPPRTESTGNMMSGTLSTSPTSQVLRVALCTNIVEHCILDDAPHSLYIGRLGGKLQIHTLLADGQGDEMMANATKRRRQPAASADKGCI